jgi:hypothetical protein
MSLKLRTNESDQPLGVLEAKRRTMQRHKPATASHKIKQRLLLRRLDLLDVRIQQYRVILPEIRRAQVLDSIGVDQLDPSPTHHGRKLLKPLEWLMMPIVAEE